MSNRVRVVMAQCIDGQSISVPPFCKAKTSKNNSEALLRCKGCAVDFSKRSHNVIVPRGKCMSSSQTSICSARRDILLLSAERRYRHSMRSDTKTLCKPKNHCKHVFKTRAISVAMWLTPSAYATEVVMQIVALKTWAVSHGALTRYNNQHALHLYSEPRPTRQ